MRSARRRSRRGGLRAGARGRRPCLRPAAGARRRGARAAGRRGRAIRRVRWRGRDPWGGIFRRCAGFSASGQSPCAARISSCRRHRLRGRGGSASSSAIASAWPRAASAARPARTSSDLRAGRPAAFIAAAQGIEAVQVASGQREGCTPALFGLGLARLCWQGARLGSRAGRGLLRGNLGEAPVERDIFLFQAGAQGAAGVDVHGAVLGGFSAVF